GQSLPHEHWCESSLSLIRPSFGFAQYRLFLSERTQFRDVWRLLVAETGAHATSAFVFVSSHEMLRPGGSTRDRRVRKMLKRLILQVLAEFVFTFFCFWHFRPTILIVVSPDGHASAGPPMRTAQANRWLIKCS